MERYVCKNCNSVWFTSSTKAGQTCDKCGAEICRTEEERVVVQNSVNLKIQSK